MASVQKLRTDILVIGGGAAGMAAAAGAAEKGAKVLLVEERPYLGGILPQCIHKGFGLGYYGQDLTGPEYSERERQRFTDSDAEYLLRARVIEIRKDRTALLSGPEGIRECSFDRCVLAAGCRERTIYSLIVSGTRPAGVFTAGEAQEMLNLGQGADYGIGDRVVILGSGDIGQIMARRLTLTGRTVIAMAEISDHLGGMRRNHRECIEAYHIPVILRSTVTEVHGFPHLTAVTLRHLETDETELVPCDTLITALGLIPEISLVEPLKESGSYPSWLYLCGNADHIHEIVDSVTTESFGLGQRLGAGIGNSFV